MDPNELKERSGRRFLPQASLGYPRQTSYDALYAVETAKRAGFPVAAMFDPREAMPDAVRAAADLYLPDFSHFPLT